MKQETAATGRCSLTVRLDRPIKQEELKFLANKLRVESCRGATPTFITYFLPGMEPGTGAWATSNFTPGLEIRIHGFDNRPEATSQTELSGASILGRWTDQGILASVITLAKTKDGYIVHRAFKKGGTFEHKVQRRSDTRYDEINSRSGVYFLIDSAGNLEIRDEEGLINRAAKM